MPTMDFETYLPTNVSTEEQGRVLAAILANEDAAGIERIVVMPSPTGRPDSRVLAEAVKHEPRVLPCCQVNPNEPDALSEVEHAVTTLGMRMLKIMPVLYNLSLDSPMAHQLMAKAREHRLIVNIHSGGHHCHPLQIGALARRYPEVPIIMDHMGYRAWGHDAILAAQDNPNIYLGTTLASFEPAGVARAAKEVGPERVIFGSNLMSAYADLAVEAIRREKMDRDVEQLVLGGNLSRLYGLA